MPDPRTTVLPDNNFQGMNPLGQQPQLPQPQLLSSATVIPIVLGDVQMQQDSYTFPSTVVLVRDGVGCNVLVDTGLPLYKNTIVGGVCARQSCICVLDWQAWPHTDCN
jgi:hypothetical protein